MSQLLKGDQVQYIDITVFQKNLNSPKHQFFEQVTCICRQLKASISRKSGFTERDGSNRKFTFHHTTINRQVTTDNNTTLEAQNPLKERNYVTIKGGSRGTPATAQKERKN
jgi:hypothetical protein